MEFIASSFINNFTGGLLEGSAAAVYRQTVWDRHRRDSVYLASGEGEKQRARQQPLFNVVGMNLDGVQRVGVYFRRGFSQCG